MKKIVSITFASVFLLSAIVGSQFVVLISAEPVHDVAVAEVGLYHYYGALGLVMPLIIPEAYPYPEWEDPIIVNVTVKNEGTETETFNVTAYYDNSSIGTQTVFNMAPGTHTTLTFTWKPYLPGYPYNPRAAWPYPIYTFSAEASVVPGETDTADNTMVDSTIKVKWPGDSNGDGHVDILELIWFTYSWYKTLLHPMFDPRMDFNGDGKIEILDLIILTEWWYNGPLDKEQKTG